MQLNDIKRQEVTIYRLKAGYLPRYIARWHTYYFFSHTQQHEKVVRGIEKIMRKWCVALNQPHHGELTIVALD